MVLTNEAARPWCSGGIELDNITVAAGKLMSMPNQVSNKAFEDSGRGDLPKGIIRIATNICPQYVCFSGCVAVISSPIKNAAIDTNLVPQCQYQIALRKGGKSSHRERDWRMRKHETCCSCCEETTNHRWHVLCRYTQRTEPSDVFQKPERVVDPDAK